MALSYTQAIDYGLGLRLVRLMLPPQLDKATFAINNNNNNNNNNRHAEQRSWRGDSQRKLQLHQRRPRLPGTAMLWIAPLQPLVQQLPQRCKRAPQCPQTRIPLPHFGQGAYASSKAGIQSLTETLALEGKEHGE